MADPPTDLHGSAPDTSDTALLLIDVINDFEFAGGKELFKHALPAARRIRRLKQAAATRGIPTIYANDNFGRWRSDFTDVLEHCLHEGVRGQPIARLLAPEPGDYFVLKPKHSAFYATTLEPLLRHIGAKTLILTGFAGNNCVLFTAGDAHMRDYSLRIPEDCLASESPRLNREALALMRQALHADTARSSIWR